MRAAFPDAQAVALEVRVDALWQMSGMGQYIYIHVVKASEGIRDDAGTQALDLSIGNQNRKA